jgi:site-specific recombinase
MATESRETYGTGPLEEFDDTVIDDPAELAALEKRLRRSRRNLASMWWLLAGGGIITALLVGLVIGHFVLR